VQPEVEKEFNSVLVETIDETITTLLSRGVADALYAHLQFTYSISKCEIPFRLDTLLSTLEKTFGFNSSRTISKAIARRLYARLGLAFSNNHDRTILEYVDEAKNKVDERGS